jgi:cell division protein FtsQ
MVKKIFTYFFIFLLTIIFASYFYFVSLLKSKGNEKEICNEVTIKVLDSAELSFVSKKEIADLIIRHPNSPIGKNINDIKLYELETYLNSQSGIKQSEIAVKRDGNMLINVTQRRPIMRIQSDEYGGFYVDETEYIFPVLKTFTYHVPIITGHIPIQLNEGHRGKVSEEGEHWLSKMIDLSHYINDRPILSSQIQQINIEKNGELKMYPTKGNQIIIFGKVDDIEYKFSKLATFYDNILPLYGWDKYSDIDLRFSDQIVCKKTNKTKEYE